MSITKYFNPLILRIHSTLAEDCLGTRKTIKFALLVLGMKNSITYRATTAITTMCITMCIIMCITMCMTLAQNYHWDYEWKQIEKLGEVRFALSLE